MAKSLRSKRKRKLRSERREKFKVKEKERLLKILGITETGKDAEMPDKSEGKDECINETDDKQGHVEQLPNTNEDIDMDQDTKQKKSGAPKIRVNRKELLKRLGKKKHFKKKNKKVKW